MTFTIKIRGSSDRPIAAEYMCPEHGRFTLTVDRDANGDAPAEMLCPKPASNAWSPPGAGPGCFMSPFVISAPRVGVRRVEAVKGGWEKPARRTFLDTRDLGEGQDIDDWRANREAIRDQERRDSLKELIDG
jgi:hypothetical protein